MAWVKLKYKILGPGSKGYVYSDPLAVSGGGWTDGPGSIWDANYNGPVIIDFEAGYAFLWAGGKRLARLALTVATTDTPTPTDTPEPTVTPVPTETPIPTDTPVPTETPIPEPFEIKLWAIVEDNAGNSSYIPLGTYTMPGSCDI